MPTRAPATTSDTARSATESEGGPYQSLFIVGRGGMGSVEAALERGPRGFERVVALKRLLPESARDPRRKEMFLREARIASLLTHRNVVHTFAFGELEGELFFAMEYVEGEPLSRLLALPEGGRQGGRGLDPSLVCHALSEVCEGLHAAHELRDAGGRLLQVVHRDVSPHNIMIGYDGSIKLLDFGVAKFDTSGNETRTGEVKGKMAYMSPEQALGEKLDRRTDLFSVGAVLFECLTGARMWGPGTDLEIMRRLALEEPPRLDWAWPEAPCALVNLYARLVARDPRRRPTSARSVADELRAFVAGNGPFAGADALRELMLNRFGVQAKRRHDLLTEALERTAPRRANILRSSLAPEAPRKGTVRNGAAEPNGTKSRRRGAREIFLVALAVVSLAGAAAVALRTGVDGRRLEDGTPGAAGSRAAATLTLSLPTAAKADLPAPVAPSASATASGGTVTSDPQAAAPKTPGGLPGDPGPATASTPRRPVPSPPSLPSLVRPPSTRTSISKLPDVDPAPF